MSGDSIETNFYCDPTQIVNLADAFPEAGYDGEATVSLEDARQLVSDSLLCGNAFVAPTGVDSPSHRRITPADIKAFTDGFDAV